jgi:hypothetical protein
VPKVSAACALVLIVLTAPAFAADVPGVIKRALMLVGAMETPRMLRDICDAEAPEAKAANSEAYDAWREKHGALMAAARQLLEDANERLVPVFKHDDISNAAY